MDDTERTDHRDGRLDDADGADRNDTGLVLPLLLPILRHGRCVEPKA